jgi:hypothetical protein
MAAKTSIVFVLPNLPGALYKAMACFSLRDIDFCKIESRPTSVDLLQRLQFQLSRSSSASPTIHSQDLPRFRYTFYLDFLAAELDDRTQNALMHLREQSDYVRVLGSFPKGSKLIGPIQSTLAALSNIPVTTEFPSIVLTNVNKPLKKKLKIAVIGFGNFGQFIAKTFVKDHIVYGVAQSDQSTAAKEIG